MTTVNNNPFKPSPPTEDERDKMRQIQEIMGCDDTKALTFLRKKGGNVEQAITAILEDPGDETIAADVNDDIMSQLRDSAASVAVTSRECSSSHGGSKIDLRSQLRNLAKLHLPQSLT